ncbi:UDP-N-acetylglucosamine 2-epimerase (hydrolyzing) [Patescibacteria group bacterium]|nr:UDP-N-acetylglucosamine 2-epimerase (hydrolyzing) [Patescibacteria group bacterium]
MDNQKRKICFVTGNRAEYSRIKTVLEHLRGDSSVDCYIVAMGSHLLESFGKTVNDIIEDGYRVDYKIFMELEGREPSTMAKSVGIATCDLATYFENKRPDLVVALMDRYENIAVAITAAFMNIPIAHMQGGEVTGTIDESVRHTITKLSHIHFPATEQSKERIIRMGERADMVFNVGDPASDLLLSTEKLTAEETLNFLNEKVLDAGQEKLNPNKPYILAVQHPVTTEFGSASEQIQESLFALKELKDTNVIFLAPNIDAGGLHILNGINKFKAEYKMDNLFIFKHIPHDIFVNLMRNTNCIVGNSSSGIRETCYFGTPTVNIGTRQQNRERGPNVIDALYNRSRIYEAVMSQINHGRYEPEFLYGDGKSGARIANILANIDLSKIEIQKKITY